MGKRIIPRARGAGGPRYRTPSHRFLGRVEYFSYPHASAFVKDIVHDPGHTAPIAIIKMDDGKEIFHIASEGMRAGDVVTYGGQPIPGNVLPIGKIPEGTKIFAIENSPGSGPKSCRCSGSFALIIGKTETRIKIQFPSGNVIELKPECRATVGVPAAGGRVEKPWVKAGKKSHAMNARGRLYPRSRGVAMSPVDHPYGGKAHRPRVSKSISRHSPPGQKVGSISSRRTGKRKGK